MSVRYLVGDVFDRMAELEDGSVDLILTSPPFLALRSYLPADHPDKAKEIGSEATPAEFIDTLLRLTAEWRRLLAPHGTLCVELGDTFAGGGQGPDAYHVGSDRPVAASKGPGWPLAKSLALVPEAYRLALAYGRNPHTGEQSPAGQWRIRNVIRWVRPNPPVGALGDKFRPATSELVVATISKDRYFDLDAVRTPSEWMDDKRHLRPAGKGLNAGEGQTVNPGFMNSPPNPAGAPPLDWWKISPTGYAGAHYAVWPPELCIRPIKAMSPEKVCRECGEPSRRVVETSRPIASDDSQRIKLANGQKPMVGRLDRPPEIGWEIERETLGFTDCGHNDWRPGLVLDPFAGTGTTLLVAHGHGRDAIGIDIDGRNAQLAEQRIGGLFLEVVQ